MVLQKVVVHRLMNHPEEEKDELTSASFVGDGESPKNKETLSGEKDTNNRSGDDVIYRELEQLKTNMSSMDLLSFFYFFDLCRLNVNSIPPLLIIF